MTTTKPTDIIKHKIYWERYLLRVSHSNRFEDSHLQCWWVNGFFKWQEVFEEGPLFLNCLPLKTGTRFLQNISNYNPATELHTPEGLNPQSYHLFRGNTFRLWKQTLCLTLKLSITKYCTSPHYKTYNCHHLNIFWNTKLLQYQNSSMPFSAIYFFHLLVLFRSVSNS